MSTMIVPPGFAKKVQEDMEEYRSDIAANSEAIGDTQLPTTAQTLTGAVAEHEGDLTEHQTAISKILPVISGSTNNSGYAINKDEYFEANGKLYKATASIPKNEAWGSSATEQGDSVHGALNSAINALNSKIATDVFTSNCTQNKSWQWLSCRKSGNVVNIAGRLSNIEIGATEITVLTLPNGYQPQTQVCAPTVALDASGATPSAYGACYIAYQGTELKIKNNTNGYYNYVDITYIV